MKSTDIALKLNSIYKQKFEILEMKNWQPVELYFLWVFFSKHSQGDWGPGGDGVQTECS